MRFAVIAAIAIAALSAFTWGASYAAHESANQLTFAPVAGSASPDGSGAGMINYIKGTSGEEPDTEWASSFRFSGLEVNTMYTVAVRGRFVDAMAFSGICSFTTDDAGNGTCQERFTGLQRLGVAQLRLGGEGGTPVLQATRPAGGPGTIVSHGGCREPEQMASGCDAPGRN
jgi:hypothetical protein